MRLLDSFIDELDRTILEDCYRGVGSAACDPIAMLKLAVYACLQGHGSPAKWAIMAEDSVSTRWLIRGLRPSRACCYRFRDRLGPVIEELVQQFVQGAIDEGLVDPQSGVLDGTAIRAAASRHRLVNRQTLQRRLQILDAAVHNDEQGTPTENAPKWLARTPHGRMEQQQRHQQAATVLAQREQENSARSKSKQLSEKNLQVSVSEPEVILGRDKEKVFGPIYTPQFIVEPSSLLVLSFDVFSQATDAGTLPVMAEKTQQVLGHPLKTIIADGLYCSLLDLRYCDQNEIELIAGGSEDATASPSRGDNSHQPVKLDKSLFQWSPEEQMFLCPEGHKMEPCHRERVPRRDGESLMATCYRCSPLHCTSCLRRSNCVDNPQKGRVIKRLDGQELVDAHQEKMKSERAKDLYKLRGQIIERAFADVKQHRGGRRLHGYGPARARVDVGLLVLAQNFLTIIRLRKARENNVVART